MTAKLHEDFEAGTNITLIAYAGTGKTTTLLGLAKAFPNREISMLTYNKSLQLETQARISDLSISNIEVMTIHGAFGRALGRTCPDDLSVTRALLEHYGGDRGTIAPLRRTVFIDEAQDLRPLLVQAIRALLRSDVQLVLAGDPCQCLYEYIYGDAASPKYLENPAEHFVAGTYIRHTLSMSYRLTPSIAMLASAVWDIELQSVKSLQQSKPVFVCVSNPWSAEVTRLIHAQISIHGPGNVMILSQSVRGVGSPVRRHVNAILERELINFNVRDSSRGFEAELQSDSVRCWTYCASKGAEARVVIAFGVDRRELGNDVGVAISRAKETLFIIQNPTESVHSIFRPLISKGAMKLISLHKIGDGYDTVKMKTITFAKQVEGQYWRPFRSVTDRLNASAVKLDGLLKFCNCDEELLLSSAGAAYRINIHSPIPIKHTIREGTKESVEISGLLSEALQYMVQVRIGKVCPDAIVRQIHGSQVATWRQAVSILKSKGFFIESLNEPADQVFPMPVSKLRALVNTGEVSVSIDGHLATVTADSVKGVNDAYERLLITKSAEDAFRLAIERVGVDSFHDLKYIDFKGEIDFQGLEKLANVTVDILHKFKLDLTSDFVFERLLKTVLHRYDSKSSAEKQVTLTARMDVVCNTTSTRAEWPSNERHWKVQKKGKNDVVMIAIRLTTPCPEHRLQVALANAIYQKEHSIQPAAYNYYVCEGALERVIVNDSDGLLAEYEDIIRH